MSLLGDSVSLPKIMKRKILKIACYSVNSNHSVYLKLKFNDLMENMDSLAAELVKASSMKDELEGERKTNDDKEKINKNLIKRPNF